jgi:mRNA interferase MazF
MDIAQCDIVLCEFYFSDLKESKKRPVLVLKDNLPFDDFVGIPISSNIKNLHDDELLIKHDSFKEGQIPKDSKLMIRKTFVVSKKIVLKKYGTISNEFFKKIKNSFCIYFECHESSNP